MMVLKITNTPKAIGAENSSVYLKTSQIPWVKLQGKKEQLSGLIVEEIIKIRNKKEIT